MAIKCVPAFRLFTFHGNAKNDADTPVIRKACGKNNASYWKLCQLPPRMLIQSFLFFAAIAALQPLLPLLSHP